MKKYNNLSIEQANIHFMNNCKDGNIKNIKILLNNYSNISYDSGFLIACTHGHLNIVKLLFNSSTKNSLQEKIDTGLKYACEGQQLNVVKYLILKCNADIKSDNYSGVINACHYGHLNILKFLAESPELKERIEPCLNNNIIFKNACQYDEKKIINYFLYDLNLTITTDITDNLKTIMKEDEYNNILFQIEKRNLFVHIDDSLNLEPTYIKSNKSKL